MLDGPAHITVAMMCVWTMAVLGEGLVKGQLKTDFAQALHLHI